MIDIHKKSYLVPLSLILLLSFGPQSHLAIAEITLKETVKVMKEDWPDDQQIKGRMEAQFDLLLLKTLYESLQRRQLELPSFSEWQETKQAKTMLNDLRGPMMFTSDTGHGDIVNYRVITGDGEYLLDPLILRINGPPPSQRVLDAYARNLAEKLLAKRSGPPKPTEPERVAKLVREGSNAANRNDWEGAINKFKEAFRADWSRGGRPYIPDIKKESPQVLFNLALVHDKSGKHDFESYAWYRAYLAAVPNANNKAQVVARLRALDSRLETTAKNWVSKAENLDSGLAVVRATFRQSPRTNIFLADAKACLNSGSPQSWPRQSGPRFTSPVSAENWAQTAYAGDRSWLGNVDLTSIEERLKTVPWDKIEDGSLAPDKKELEVDFRNQGRWSRGWVFRTGGPLSDYWDAVQDMSELAWRRACRLALYRRQRLKD